MSQKSAEPWLEFRRKQKLQYSKAEWAELPEKAKAMVQDNAPELMPNDNQRDGRIPLRDWELLSDAEQARFSHLSPWNATDATHPFGPWSL